jgi:hypothetical protein
MIQPSRISLGTFAGIATICGLLNSAHGDIVHDRENFITSFHNRTFGQTFTAEGGEIASIGVRLVDVNAFLGDFEITISLHDEVFGTLLDSQTMTIPDGPLPFWTDFDFSGNILTEGGLYSFLISSASERGALGNAQHTSGVGDPIGPDYTGGDMYINGNLLPLKDLTFRVLQVPAPGSLGIVAGAVMMATRRRR